MEAMQFAAHQFRTLCEQALTMPAVYSAPDREAEYCDERVCLSVCVYLSVRDHIFGTIRPIVTNIFVHVTYGRVSVLLWWRNDTLCTSGFMEDVIGCL